MPWEEVQTIQWPKEKTFIDLQNTTQKVKELDCGTWKSALN